MPGWKLHLLVGLASAALFTYLAGWPLTPQLALLAGVASLTPDLDHPKARLSRLLHLAVVAGSFAFFYQAGPAREGLTWATLQRWVLLSVGAAALVLGVLWLARKSVLRHRGFTHSLAATVLFAGLVWAATISLALAVAGGVAYASHWLLDGEWKVA